MLRRLHGWVRSHPQWQLIVDRFIDWARQWPWIYPRGVATITKDWVERSQRKQGWYAGLRGDWFESLYPGGVTVHAPPAHAPAKVPNLFREVSTRRYPAAFVSQLSGAHLVGDQGIVLTRDNHLLGEYYHEFATRSVRRAIWSKPFGLVHSNVRRLSAPVALLAAPQGCNYYHWLFDVLPRIHLLERWRTVIERYAVPDRLDAAQLESLQLLGIGEDKLLRLQQQSRYRCQNLYAPSLPGSEGCSPPWVARFLRESFLPQAAATPDCGPFVYIMRGRDTARPVLNEPELIAKIERLGFRAILPEQKSFLDQVAMFRSARLIVAAHGAGLANLIFATNCAVLEIFSADYPRADCYFTLARQAGHAYDYWLDPEKAGSTKPWGGITVDLPAIVRKIEALMMLPSPSS